MTDVDINKIVSSNEFLRLRELIDRLRQAVEDSKGQGVQGRG
jgi:hypothetical protein